MERTLIAKEGNLSLYRLSQPIYGGLYAVVDSRSKKAKTGLNLSAAFEIYTKLTLEQALHNNGLIETPKTI